MAGTQCPDVLTLKKYKTDGFEKCQIASIFCGQKWINNFDVKNKKTNSWQQNCKPYDIFMLAE